MRIRNFILLHVLLFVYSLGGVFSKLAAGEDFFSVPFFIFYSMVLVIMAVYAIGWQQIIKKFPLSLAFANKAITLVWGFLWGLLLYNEPVSWQKIVGILLVMVGIYTYSLSREKEKKGML